MPLPKINVQRYSKEQLVFCQSHTFKNSSQTQTPQTLSRSQNRVMGRKQSQVIVSQSVSQSVCQSVTSSLLTLWSRFSIQRDPGGVQKYQMRFLRRLTIGLGNDTKMRGYTLNVFTQPGRKNIIPKFSIEFHPFSSPIQVWYNS